MKNCKCPLKCSAAAILKGSQRVVVVWPNVVFCWIPLSRVYQTARYTWVSSGVGQTRVPGILDHTRIPGIPGTPVYPGPLPGTPCLPVFWGQGVPGTPSSAAPCPVRQFPAWSTSFSDWVQARVARPQHALGTAPHAHEASPQPFLLKHRLPVKLFSAGNAQTSSFFSS